MAIRAVFFDVGETLIDETREWGLWADWLGVPRFTFFAVLGAAIARGQHHNSVFEFFRSGFDIEEARRERRAEGWQYGFELGDLYPDVLPCLTALREQNYIVGIAGNQLPEAEASLRALGVPADIIGTSASWGVEKPSPDFFAKILTAIEDMIGPIEPSEVAYVGDHPRNDVVAAAKAGLETAFLRRGPWGLAHADSKDAARASIRLEGLAELPTILSKFGSEDQKDSDSIDFQRSRPRRGLNRV